MSRRERPLVTCTPGVRSGWPCIAGTSVGVWIVAERFAAGESVPDLAAAWDVTTPAIRAALEVYEGMRQLFEAYDKAQEGMAITQDGRVVPQTNDSVLESSRTDFIAEHGPLVLDLGGHRR